MVLIPIHIYPYYRLLFQMKKNKKKNKNKKQTSGRGCSGIGSKKIKKINKKKKKEILFFFFHYIHQYL